MRVLRLALSMTVLAGALTVGCTQSTEVGRNSAEITGGVRAVGEREVPPAASVYTVWTVSAGSPDYTYVYGEGESAGATYGLSFDGDLPAEATNGGLGVGILVLTSAAIPTGRLSDASEATLEGAVLGGAAGYAVIWRDEVLETPYRDWALDFPPGYSCGELVPAPAGETFDSFRPIPCESIEIQVDDVALLDFGNWT